MKHKTNLLFSQSLDTIASVLVVSNAESVKTICFFRRRYNGYNEGAMHCESETIHVASLPSGLSHELFEGMVKHLPGFRSCRVRQSARKADNAEQNCFGFIRFNDCRFAADALALISRDGLNGAPVRVEFTKPDQTINNWKSSLLLRRLPSDVTPRELGHLLRPFAGFQGAWIVRDGQETFARATFSDSRCALACQLRLDGYLFDEADQGSTVRVSLLS